MTDREKVINGLECLSSYEVCYGSDCPYYNFDCTQKIAQDVLELLKEQESEWLEDSDPGQEYGTTWACRRCMHSIHKPFVWNPYDSKMEYCPFCGRKMVVKWDADD